MGDREFAVDGWHERVVLRRLSDSMQAALERLVYPGDTVRHLTDLITRSGVPGELARFTHDLRRLAGRGLLWIAVHSEDGPLVTLEPTSPMFDPTDRYVPDGRYVLSRFAYVRRVGDKLVLESPLSAARVLVEDQRMAPMLWQMTAPMTATAVRGQTLDLSAEAAEALLSLLATARILSRVLDDGTLAEDEHASLRMWEFHDLLFHARSRLGRHDAPSGGTFLWVGVVEQPPALRPNYRGESVALFRPNLEELERRDPPFVQVAERRRSVREYGCEPITVQQLGEFLYRVGRVTKRYQHRFEVPRGPVTMEFATRPYPSAGALYELEIYPLVQHCGGLDPGTYHYDPLDHRLNRVSADQQHTEKLWAGAAFDAQIRSSNLQVLLILAARFPRISWKYSSLAYSEILKDVGVLMHSMYLTATAMNLAPCALGAGDSDAFAKAIGSDYYAETSVGEFLLGSCAETRATLSKEAATHSP
jgi:SagB-type dehydrogenase family enzyme